MGGIRRGRGIDRIWGKMAARAVFLGGSQSRFRRCSSEICNSQAKLAMRELREATRAAQDTVRQSRLLISESDQTIRRWLNLGARTSEEQRTIAPLSGWGQPRLDPAYASMAGCGRSGLGSSSWLLDMVAAADFLSQVGLLFEVWRECVRVAGACRD
jgi:hypothetical protein